MSVHCTKLRSGMPCAVELGSWYHECPHIHDGETRGEFGVELKGPLTVLHDNPASDPGSRFDLPGGRDMIIPADGTITFVQMPGEPWRIRDRDPLPWCASCRSYHDAKTSHAVFVEPTSPPILATYVIRFRAPRADMTNAEMEAALADADALMINVRRIVGDAMHRYQQTAGRPPQPLFGFTVEITS